MLRQQQPRLHKSGLSRAFPVDAHCSERHLAPEPPSMSRAANEVQSLHVFGIGVAKALTMSACKGEIEQFFCIVSHA
jgi:hypothetical protein